MESQAFVVRMRQCHVIIAPTFHKSLMAKVVDYVEKTLLGLIMWVTILDLVRHAEVEEVQADSAARP